ncbi:MAG TPA: hypothetical protein VGO93_00570 [Candidatus Xenobia bacterium]|jgi:hypothetical protein
MKRKTTPAEPVTLTAQRLVLTAPDGSPRMELAIGDHTMPMLRMFDPAGTCRIELGLECNEKGDNHWPTVSFCDREGHLTFNLFTDDDRIEGQLKVAGVKVWDLEMDAVAMAHAARRRKGGVR